jgi:site-specific DNA-methyltransferase (adenine-specific)
VKPELFPLARPAMPVGQELHTRAFPSCELRLGRFERALEGVGHFDALITDPPYSARTRDGQRSGSSSPDRSGGKAGGIDYGAMTQQDVVCLVSWARSRAARWFVMFGDHYTVGWALAALEESGWYTFPPAVWEKTDAMPRLQADGPSPDREFLAIARPRRKLLGSERRHRMGTYRGPSARRTEETYCIGQKPEWLMRQLVRDYSEPGDLVVDPFAGSGTTLVSAMTEGRRALGAERDRGVFVKAGRRIDQRRGLRV